MTDKIAVAPKKGMSIPHPDRPGQDLAAYGDLVAPSRFVRRALADRDLVKTTPEAIEAGRKAEEEAKAATEPAAPETGNSTNGGSAAGDAGNSINGGSAAGKKAKE